MKKKEKRIEEDKVPLKDYFAIISRKTKIKCLGIVAMALAGSVLASIWPVKLGEIYNAVSSGEISTLAKGAAAVALFGAIYLAAEGITILRRVMVDYIIATHESEVRQNSIEKMLKMPVAYNHGCVSGEKTAQLNQGVAGLSQLVKIMCNDVVATILVAVCTIAQVIMNAPLIMSAVMMLYLAITIAISAFQIRSQNGIREDIISRKNALDGQVCQTISNLELVRSFNAEKYERRRLQPAIEQISEVEKKHHKFMGSFDGIKQFTKISFQMIIILLSIVLISKGLMSPGAVITVCLLYQQLVKPIDEVYRFMDETASSVVKAKVLAEVYSSEEDPVFAIPEAGAEQITNAEDRDVVLKDVLITTPKMDKALAKYENISIPGGKKVALIGASGCGKTTLVRCIDRFYPYSQGSVTLFGRDLKDYSQRELTETVCYIPQNTFFFTGTVRDNLKYGLDRPVTEGELCDALKKACLFSELVTKVVESGEYGMSILDMPVTEGGDNFSGGQRQRLTLARAFLRSPKLYILDESTANIDEGNIEAVLNNMETHAAKIGAGILYISHDSKVVDRCDVKINVNNLLKARSDKATQDHESDELAETDELAEAA